MNKKVLVVLLSFVLGLVALMPTHIAHANPPYTCNGVSNGYLYQPDEGYPGFGIPGGTDFVGQLFFAPGRTGNHYIVFTIPLNTMKVQAYWTESQGDITSSSFADWHEFRNEEVSGGGQHSIRLYAGNRQVKFKFIFDPGVWGANIHYNFYCDGVDSGTTNQGGSSNANTTDGNNTYTSADWLTRNRSDSISPIGDVDWFKFELTTRSAVTLRTAGSRGDTFMKLYNSNLQQIDSDDDDGEGYFSYISIGCLSAGTYYVKVNEYGNNELIPNYTIRLSSSACSSSGSSSSQANNNNNSRPATTTFMRYYVRSGPACDPTGNVQLEVVPSGASLWFYVTKCAGGPFIKSGSYYIYVDGIPRFGPYPYQANATYAYQSIVPSASGLPFVGSHDYQAKVVPNDRSGYFLTNPVTIEGRQESR